MNIKLSFSDKCCHLIIENKVGYKKAHILKQLRHIIDGDFDKIIINFQNFSETNKIFLDMIENFVIESARLGKNIKLIFNPSLVQWYFDIKGLGLLKNVEFETNYETFFLNLVP